jgi:hypothetical protein
VAHLGAAESVSCGLVRRHDPPLAVEDDDGLGVARHQGPDTFLVHHSFTTELPSANPAQHYGRR